MKSLLCIGAVAVLLASPTWAHDHDHAHETPNSAHTAAPAAPSKAIALDAHTREDVERHRGMARAHQEAAQCLEQGQSYDACQKQLQTSCKGLALGKNCGMRHSH